MIQLHSRTTLARFFEKICGKKSSNKDDRTLRFACNERQRAKNGTCDCCLFPHCHANSTRPLALHVVFTALAPGSSNPWKVVVCPCHTDTLRCQHAPWFCGSKKTSPFTGYESDSDVMARLQGRRVSHDNPRTPNKRAHFRPRRFKHHPNSSRRHPERDTKRPKWWREREKKKREIFGPPPFGAPPFAAFGAPKGVHFSMFFFSSFCSVFFFFFLKKKKNAKRLKHQFWPKSAWPKSATQILAKVGQLRMAVGSAKVGISRVRVLTLQKW